MVWDDADKSNIKYTCALKIASMKVIFKKFYLEYHLFICHEIFWNYRTADVNELSLNTLDIAVSFETQSDKTVNYNVYLLIIRYF